jgi:trehalose 6-phosphate synthase/phosphatase
MDRILIVSNRLPVSVEVGDEGFDLIPSVGGLATGLRSFYRRYDSRWIGWPGVPSEVSRGLEGLRKGLSEQGCVPVEMSSELLDGYYYGFANRTVWPLFHYFQQFTEYRWDLWEAYVEANRRFADRVAEEARPGDGIWIHDYHLLLLPRMLRERLSDVSIGFFLHIPFPSFELFRLLPWRDRLMDGMLGSDLIGFHSYDYARHFLSSVLRLRGYDRYLSSLDVDGRRVKVDVFPIGIDYEKFAGAQAEQETRAFREDVENRMKGRRLILSVDRLDYTKGITHRLEAFDLFLRDNPEYRSRVKLVLLVVPSRTRVPQYNRLKTELDRMVGRINSRYSDVTGGPISYMFRSLPFPELAALYGAADVGLVTPIRDGMNLVAKEYVASQRENHGMVVLSEMAGAAMELSEAIMVNPNNTPQVAGAIREALEMDPGEKRKRIEAMQERIGRYDVIRWAGDFVDSLEEVRRQQREDACAEPGEEDRSELLRTCRESESRLILLNYDGTLVPPGRDLEQVRPDGDMLELLRRLRDAPGSQLVLYSGRRRESMDDLFGEEFSLVAEAGFWVRDPGGRWHMIAPLHDAWKEEVRPLMQFYVDRTPGAFLQEKDFSLVWHCRRTEPELARVRSRELLLSLYAQTASMELDVLEDRRRVEVRNADINKGRAVAHWLERRRWNLIVAAGDDSTDEPVYNALPERAFTFKVGGGPTEARFRVQDTSEIRRLLGELLDCMY